MQHSPIRKFNPFAFEAEAKGLKVYHLNIGQPDIKTPDVFWDAVKGFNKPVLAYAESQGITDLQDAIIDYFKRFGMDLKRGNILVTNGGSEALSMIYTSILDQGDDVMLAEPFYTNYQTFIAAAGGNVAPITTYAEDGYNYAIKERLEKALTPRTKALSLVNPGNPTGKILTREEMDVVRDFVKEHDLWLIADEVYREFAYDGQEMTTFGQYKDIEDRVIIVDSVSKRFSACGARVGCIVTKNEELYSNLMKLAQGRLCCPTLDQVGAAAMYRLPENFFDEVRAEYEARRDASYEALMKIPGLVCKKPGGAFYITAKLPVKNAESFLMYMLKEFSENGETAMYAPAAGFYATEGMGLSEMRIAYVLKKEDMVRGIELIQHGIESYKAAGKDI